MKVTLLLLLASLTVPTVPKTPESLVVRQYPATVKRVIDGDTIEVLINLGCAVTLDNQHIRFLGCYAPELSTSNGPIAAAIVSRWLPTNQFIILGMPLDRKGHEKKDLYGRWLSDLYVGQTNLIEVLTKTQTNLFQTKP
jgi:endonuclease YncB( thermonuclease family)